MNAWWRTATSNHPGWFYANGTQTQRVRTPRSGGVRPLQNKLLHSSGLRISKVNIAAGLLSSLLLDLILTQRPGETSFLYLIHCRIPRWHVGQRWHCLTVRILVNLANGRLSFSLDNVTVGIQFLSLCVCPWQHRNGLQNICALELSVRVESLWLHQLDFRLLCLLFESRGAGSRTPPFFHPMSFSWIMNIDLYWLRQVRFAVLWLSFFCDLRDRLLMCSWSDFSGAALGRSTTAPCILHLRTMALYYHHWRTAKL